MNKMQDALKSLDKPTQEDVRMATAQNPKAEHTADRCERGCGHTYPSRRLGLKSVNGACSSSAVFWYVGDAHTGLRVRMYANENTFLSLKATKGSGSVERGGRERSSLCVVFRTHPARNSC